MLLPATHLDPDGGPVETRLLRSGAAGLHRVFSDAHWTIYEVPRPSTLISGPGASEVIVFGHQTVEGRVSVPGTYLLRVRFNPYWQVRPGGSCIRRAKDGMTALELRRPGLFTLSISDELQSFVRTLVDSRGAYCSGRDS